MLLTAVREKMSQQLHSFSILLQHATGSNKLPKESEKVPQSKLSIVLQWNLSLIDGLFPQGLFPGMFYSGLRCMMVHF